MSKNFINECNPERIDNLLEKRFKADTKNLFLDFQKFEKFKNKKVYPKSCLFVSLPSDFLQFQKQLSRQNPRRTSILNHYEIINT